MVVTVAVARGVGVVVSVDDDAGIAVLLGVGDPERAALGVAAGDVAGVAGIATEAGDAGEIGVGEDSPLDAESAVSPVGKPESSVAVGVAMVGAAGVGIEVRVLCAPGEVVAARDTVAVAVVLESGKGEAGAGDPEIAAGEAVVGLAC